MYNIINLKSKNYTKQCLQNYLIRGEKHRIVGKAAENAVTRTSESLRDLRVAEVCQMDIHLKDGKTKYYRTKIKVSFKYEG